MTLAAQQVVDGIAARLVPTGATVSTSRMHPFIEADLPAWRVVAGSEDIDTSVGEDIETHELEVVCELTVRAVGNVDDAMHAATATGLAAIHGTVAPSYTVHTQSIQRQLNPEGEAATARVTVRLGCRFFTHPAAPETLL